MTANGKPNSSNPNGTVEVRGSIDRWVVVNGTKGGKEIHCKLVVPNTLSNRLALSKMDDDAGVNVIGLQLDLEAATAREAAGDDDDWDDHPDQSRFDDLRMGAGKEAEEAEAEAEEATV